MLQKHPHKEAANSQPPTARRFTLRAPGQPAAQRKKPASRLASVHHMNESYQVITTPEGIRQACEQLQHADAIGTDCETTSLDPLTGQLRLLQLAIPEQTYVFDHRKIGSAEAYRPLKQIIEEPRRRIISHNSKFEQKWLKYVLGIEPATVFCTQLAHVLVDFSGSHNLESTAKRFLDLTIDKTLQHSDWTRDEISEAQLQYAARDAQVLIPLRDKLITALRENNLFRVAQLEFEAIACIAQVELNGVFVDPDMWSKQLATIEHQHEIISRELQIMLADGSPQHTLFGQSDINLNSHPQILDALKMMGVPLDNATRESVLLPLKNDYPVVGKLLEYRELEKQRSGYGQSWLSEINKKTGRIHPEFSQIGAPTGRMSCSHPNVQQVPTTKEYRSCFRAPEGRSLVISDYSQIELRILASFSKDRGFLEAFRSGADLHRTTAASIFNVSLESVTKDQRDFAKRLNFGVVYGIGAQRLSNMTGLELSDAEALLNKYFATYRQLDEHLRRTAQEAVDNRSCRTASGRLVRYKFDPRDRQQVSSVKRQGRNAPIQGTGSDILKRALRLLHEGLRGTSAQIVNIIHDEIVVECDQDDAPTISEIVAAKMTQAATEYITDVPMLAEPAIAQEWVK
jgi:DNA polymerase I-like protein with 3'-5' exonuclease and polymerase domains